MTLHPQTVLQNVTTWVSCEAVVCLDAKLNGEGWFVSANHQYSAAPALLALNSEEGLPDHVFEEIIEDYQAVNSHLELLTTSLGFEKRKTLRSAGFERKENLNTMCRAVRSRNSSSFATGRGINISPIERSEVELYSRLQLEVHPEINIEQEKQAVIERLRSPTTTSFLARSGTAIVGSCAVHACRHQPESHHIQHHDSQLLFVFDLMISHPQRGRGLGRQLLERIDRYAAENSYTMIVTLATKSLQPFYAKLGFENSFKLERWISGKPTQEARR